MKVLTRSNIERDIMDELIRNKNARKVSSVSAPLIQILQEHSERLLKLEAIVAINTKRDIMSERPTRAVVFVEPVVVPEPTPPVKVEPEPMPEPEPEPEPEVVAAVEVVSEVVVEAVKAVAVEPTPPAKPPRRANNTAIAEEIERLISAKDEQSRAITNTINQLDEIEFDLSVDGSESVCTEDCRELVKEFKADVDPVGAWRIEDEQCGGCTKAQMKAFKKRKKEADKQRARDQKAIKELQKKLVKEEMRELQTRLKNIKKGRDESHGLDNTKQQDLRNELKKVADGTSTAEFKIQMYV